jgi:hypothetical protein
VRRYAKVTSVETAFSVGQKEQFVLDEGFAACPLRKNPSLFIFLLRKRGEAASPPSPIQATPLT